VVRIDVPVLALGTGACVKFLVIASLADSLLNFREPLMVALQKKGFVVHVAAPDLPHGSVSRELLESKGFVVHEVSLSRTGTNPVVDLKSFLQLWRLMRKVRPDKVLAYTVKPVIYGMLAAWLAGVPQRFALITGLGYAFQNEASRGRIQKLVQSLYKAALRKVDKVFFQNPDDEALFRKKGLISQFSASCVVNGSGVDVSSFQVTPQPEGSPTFLMIARLLGDKGVREYVDAAKQIKKAKPDIKFSLVGWIDENPDAITQQELDCWISSGVIDYLGRLADVRPAIAACSVYVLPSYREGTPRTVLEAMAMGRAIVTTDAPGCRETVVHGENGFLVPVQDSEALAQAMHLFIDKPALQTIMGARSRQIAEEKYDVHKVNAVMLAGMGVK
jgi:glycosyltransferase involved in cell wall biosynthesis